MLRICPEPGQPDQATAKDLENHVDVLPIGCADGMLSRAGVSLLGSKWRMGVKVAAGISDRVIAQRPHQHLDETLKLPASIDSENIARHKERG